MMLTKINITHPMYGEDSMTDYQMQRIIRALESERYDVSAKTAWKIIELIEGSPLRNDDGLCVVKAIQTQVELTP